MVTKEQALKDIECVYDPTEDPDEAWAAYERVRAFIEQSQPVPEGFVLVPVEPTEEMMKAADESDREYTMRNFGTRHPVIQGGAYDHYIAMLAAAPKPGGE